MNSNLITLLFLTILITTVHNFQTPQVHIFKFINKRELAIRTQ